MRNKELSKKILKRTFGILATVVDLFLFSLLIMGEVAFSGCDAYLMPKLQKRLGRLLLKDRDRIIRNAFNHAFSQGWLKKDGKLTAEGKERLKNLIPVYLPQRCWDEKWYLVIFDIPEKMKRKRDILREKLKLLGFGQLQASVWISPINYLGNIEEIIKYYNLEPYVIFSETEKIGKETSQVLAERIWGLKAINKEYKKFISQYEKADELEKFWLKFQYFNILRKDPQLPKKLLPEDWLGKKAKKLIKIKLI